MKIAFSEAYSLSGEKHIDVFADEFFTRLHVVRGEFTQGNDAWEVRHVNRSKRDPEMPWKRETETLAKDLTVKAAREFAERELERMIEAGEEYRDFDYTPVFEGTPTITPEELMARREEIIAAYENNKGRRGYGEDATHKKLLRLWGLDAGGYEVETFFCQSTRPFARAVRFRLGLAPCGLWVWGFEADLQEPAIRSFFSLTAGSSLAVDDSFWDDVPFATRDDALRTGAATTIEMLDNFLAEKQAKLPDPYVPYTADSYATVCENTEIVKAWLTSLLTAQARERGQKEQSPAPLVDANGQMLLFPASEGLPEDYKDERRIKAMAAREEAEIKKARIDAAKRQITLLSKIRDREAHHAQVMDVIDEARLESLKHPGEVFFAADYANEPKVLTFGEWKELGKIGQARAALYAIWMNEQETSWEKVKDLVDVPRSAPQSNDEEPVESEDEDTETPEDEEIEFPEDEDPVDALSALAEMSAADEAADGPGDEVGAA
jgi:hypothetical protein